MVQETRRKHRLVTENRRIVFEMAAIPFPYNGIFQGNIFFKQIKPPKQNKILELYHFLQWFQCLFGLFFPATKMSAKKSVFLIPFSKARETTCRHNLVLNEYSNQGIQVLENPRGSDMGQNVCTYFLNGHLLFFNSYQRNSRQNKKLPCIFYTCHGKVPKLVRGC